MSSRSSNTVRIIDPRRSRHRERLLDAAVQLFQRNLFGVNDSVVLVAVKGLRVVGVLTLGTSNEVSVVIAKRHRRQGLAQDLLYEACLRYPRRGLWAQPASTPGYYLLEASGWFPYIRGDTYLAPDPDELEFSEIENFLNAESENP